MSVNEFFCSSVGRKNAFEGMYNYYKSLKNTLAASYVGEIKENAFCTNVKKYNSTIERSLFNDNIELNVYKTLIDTIHDKMNLIYEYMDLRKKCLKLGEIHMYDIYVDLVKEYRNIYFDTLVLIHMFHNIEY